MDEGEQTLRKSGRTIWFVLLALALLVMVLLGLRMRAAYSARHVTLPDGSTVELLGTSVGLAQFRTESKWNRVKRYLPARFQKWIPSNTTGMICGTTNSVTVHVRVQAGQATVGSAPWSAVDTEDEAGFHYSPNGGVCSSSDSSGNVVYAISLNCFPRRQREFPIRFLDPNGAVMGTLRIVNPLSGPFPEWKPLPLPQTQTNGPVTLTLSGFEEHVQGRWTNNRPKWQVDSSHAAWVHAKARLATFLDASGNEGYKLSPREPAWKVRTLVYRERVQDFAAADEVVVATNVALPAAGNYTAVDTHAVCSGVTLKLLVLSSPGRFGISNGVTRFMLPVSQGTSGYSTSSDGRNTVETWGGSSPFLVLDTLDMQPGDEVLFYLKDDQGREFNERKTGSTSGWGARNVFTPSFNLPSDAKSVTVQVALSRPLTLEFLVKPEDVLSSGK